MKKRLLIVALLAVFGISQAFAFDYLVNGIYYTLLGGDSVKVTYSIKGDNNKTAYTGNVTIPSTVRLGGVWRRVVWIGDSAFYKCTGLTGITMPNSITKVGQDAFRDCTGLTSVSLSDSVTVLVDGAFNGCSALTGISLPNTIKRICLSAFRECTRLTSIILPDSLKVIEPYVFYNCQYLSSITMPNTITEIGKYAFYYCQRLKPTFPDSLRKIGTYAFSECADYSSCTGGIVLPNNLDTIEEFAFYGCNYLTSVYLPNSVKHIGYKTFVGCNRITSPVFNDKIFAWCPNNYSNYTIPNGIETITHTAFWYSTALNSITIPNSVKNIGCAAFEYCTYLTTVNMSDSLVYMGSWAFSKCSRLPSISLPKSVQLVDDNAFNGCTSLNRIEIHPSHHPSFDSQCFYNVPGNFFVPCDSLVPYQTALTAVGVASSRVYGNPYSITVTPDGNQRGSITFLDQPYTCPDSIAIFQAVNNYGYTFLKWSDGYTTNPRTIHLTADTILQAIFQKNKYTVSSNCTNGSVTGVGTYDYLTQVTLQAVANEHYHFTSWNDGSILPTSILMLEKDTIVTANFALDKFKITFANYDNTILQSDSLEYGTMPSYRGTTPTRPTANGRSYTFKGWAPTIGVATADTIYYAQYDSVVATYTISFVNYDGTTLQSGTVTHGVTPVYSGSTPTKPATAQYSYAFKGWNPAIAVATAAVTYTAQYDSTLRQYTISFVNYNGSSLQSSSVNYGVMPTYTGATPTKPSTAQYNYTFKGWSPALTTVTAAATYTAQYDSTLRQYTISFVNYNGTSLQSSNVNYGVMPTYTGATPTKPSTAQYNYTFKGWSPALTTVTAAKTYTAQYDSVVRQYNISFVNYNGTSLQSSSVNYGVMPTYTGATPTKPSTAQYNYTFKGWSPALTTVTGAKTYTAQYDSVIRQYNISFVNYNGTSLQSSNVNYGVMPSYTGATPTKPSTAQYNYTFKGWSPALTTVTGAKTYTAQYDSVIRQYNISFVNYNGTSLQSSNVNYGVMPSYTGATPTKPSTAQYNYTFKGWSPALTTVTAAATYTAQYDSTLRQYTISFVNYNGTSLQSSSVNYGVMPTYTGAAPTKPSTAQYNYTFKGWSPALTTVTGTKTYTAQYDSVIRQYNISFVNYNGTSLQSSSVNYGVMPTYTGATPTKPSTAQYNYTFKGWSPALTTVTAAKTYTAQYDSVIRQYNIAFVNYNGTSLQSSNVNYGVMPTYTGATPTKPSTAQYNYTFKGWSPALTTVTGAKTYTAQYDSVIRQYNIAFVNYNGTSLQSSNVNYGVMPTYTGATPTKPSTAQYNYTFKGWSPALTTVTGAKTYTAQYDSVIRQYSIVFVNYNGTTLQSGNLNYGATPQYTGSTPTKPATAQYTYTFKGWNPAVSSVICAATYTAQYDSVINQYTVTFVNYDGTTLLSGSLNYGVMPAYTGTTPTKPATVQYTYTFRTWSPVLATVTGTATYTAQYDSVINQYNVTFVNYDGTTLQSGNVNYGVVPTYTGSTPTKPATAQYTYSFKGWTPALTSVTGAATYTAQFDSVINQYTISFVNYDGTTLQSSSVNYGTTPTYTGATPTKPASVQYTYTFKNWSPAIVVVTGAATYTAQYDSVLRSYTVSVNYDSSKGSVAGAGTYNYGASITLTATAVNHYHFVDWNNTVTTPTITFTVTGDSTLTANFEIDQHTITAYVNDTTFGSVTGAGTYDYGTVVTLTAVPNDHYVFTSWSNGSTSPTITVTLTYDMSITANFRPAQYQVAVMANDNSYGTVTGSGTYDYGTVVTLTATAYNGYEFTGWSNGETTSVITIIVESDTTFTANFTAVQTSVDDVDEVEYVAYTQGKTIFVHGASDQPIYLYDMTGQLVAYEEKASEETSFNVYADGIYVVMVGESKKTIRVVVK